MANDYVAAGTAPAAHSAGAQSQPTPEGGGLGRADETARDDKVTGLEHEILEMGKRLDEMELDNEIGRRRNELDIIKWGSERKNEQCG